MASRLPLALTLSVCIAFVGNVCGDRLAHAQEVWSGYDFSFNHPANSAVADQITGNVQLTRGATRGLFNAAYEASYLDAYSPEFTSWATAINNPDVEIAAENYANLIFTNWETAYGGMGSLASNIVGANAVLFLELDDIYLDIRFTSWGQGAASGGAFAYLRAAPPALEPTGDYNENLVVDAADYTLWRDTLGQLVASPGDGADGNRSGAIDAGDYDHWKARFGNVIPAGSSFAIPEPAASALLAVAVLAAAICRGRRVAT